MNRQSIVLAAESYAISLCTVVAFPIVFIPLYIRFKTMRYQFDETGVSMCWGFFWRKEVHLTYRRSIYATKCVDSRDTQN